MKEDKERISSKFSGDMIMQHSILYLNRLSIKWKGKKKKSENLLLPKFFLKKKKTEDGLQQNAKWI